MRKKGLAMMSIAVILIFALATVHLVAKWKGGETIIVHSSTSSYYLRSSDRMVNEIIEGFEQPALYYSLSKTIKDLAEHGGISSSVDKTKYGLKTDDDGVLYWTFADENEKFQNKIPFTYYKDENKLIGKTDINIDIPQDPEPKQVLVQIVMKEAGSVDVEINGKTEVISKTGNYVFDSSLADTITISSSTDDVAVLRNVIVSPYEDDFVNSANEALADKVNAYVTSLNTKLSGTPITVGNFEAAFLNSTAEVAGVTITAPSPTNGIKTDLSSCDDICNDVDGCNCPSDCFKHDASLGEDCGVKMKTCAEESGQVCSAGTECSYTTIVTADIANCCLADCVAVVSEYDTSIEFQFDYDLNDDLIYCNDESMEISGKLEYGVTDITDFYLIMAGLEDASVELTIGASYQPSTNTNANGEFYFSFGPLANFGLVEGTYLVEMKFPGKVESGKKYKPSEASKAIEIRKVRPLVGGC